MVFLNTMDGIVIYVSAKNVFSNTVKRPLIDGLVKKGFCKSDWRYNNLRLRQEGFCTIRLKDALICGSVKKGILKYYWRYNHLRVSQKGFFQIWLIVVNTVIYMINIILNQNIQISSQSTRKQATFFRLYFYIFASSELDGLFQENTFFVIRLHDVDVTWRIENVIINLCELWFEDCPYLLSLIAPVMGTVDFLQIRSHMLKIEVI
jgi:uncharacterized membrane protein YhaH (DUF805 family)